MPTITVGEIESKPASKLGNIDDLKFASVTKPYEAEVEVDVNVTLASANYRPWTISTLDVVGYVHNPDPAAVKNEDKEIGSGSKKRISIGSFSSTSFILVFSNISS